MSAQLCMAMAKQADFQDRIKYFLQKASLGVMIELDTVNNHADRLLYAKEVLAGRASVYEVSVGVTTNPTVSATINGGGNPTDSDLEYCVSTEMYNSFAG